MIGKLGKRPPVDDSRNLKLARYIDRSKLPAPPERRAWSAAMHRPWGMMANDKYGDCTVVTAGHMIQAWTAAAHGAPVTLSDQVILSAYSAITGFDPDDPSTDNGAVVLDVLRYWRRHGIGGHKIGAFAFIELGDARLVETAIDLFGGVYLGAALPKTIDGQAIWTLPDASVPAEDAEPGSLGGHAIAVVDYSPQGLVCVTWGELQPMSWAWWHRYCVAPQMRVLTADLRWIPAGDVTVGMQLLGFDENATGKGFHRRWRLATVLEAQEMILPCHEIQLEDGTTLVSSSGHRWLAAHHRNAHWISTDETRFRGRCHSRLVKPLDVWVTDYSWEAGYLAAALDGEGHLTQQDLTRKGRGRGFGVAHTAIGFSQKSNSMLAEVRHCLKILGFDVRDTPPRASGVTCLHLRGGRPELLRFLGAVRPRRLLDIFTPDRFGAMNNQRRIRVIGRHAVGPKPVAAIKTDTGTFLVEGYASHNCDEVYAVISDDFLKDGQTPHGFARQDLVADLRAVTHV